VLPQVKFNKFIELVVEVVVIHAADPAIRYRTLYPVAPATALHEMVAPLVVMFVADNPAGATHTLVQVSVLKLAGDEYPLAVDEPLVVKQYACTCHS
jgi:hypothetical protein